MSEEQLIEFLKNNLELEIKTTGEGNGIYRHDFILRVADEIINESEIYTSD